MCARYMVYTEEEMLEMRSIIAEVERQLWGLDGKLCKGEVRPSDIAPVLTVNGPLPMRWGFTQPRSDDGTRLPPFTGLTLHARSETAALKPMFREAYRTCRCALPATSFCEWGTDSRPGPQLSLLPDGETGGGKVKYLFTLPALSMFYMAGLYMVSKNEPLPRFVVMTAPAAGCVAAVHDRMPVLLDEAGMKGWLESGDISRIINDDIRGVIA